MRHLHHVSWGLAYIVFTSIRTKSNPCFRFLLLPKIPIYFQHLKMRRKTSMRELLHSVRIKAVNLKLQYCKELSDCNKDRDLNLALALQEFDAKPISIIEPYRMHGDIQLGHCT